MAGMTMETTMQSPLLAPVQKWFGESFNNLHPLLQQIHIHGGTLQGEIDIKQCKGRAGFLEFTPVPVFASPADSLPP